MSHLTSLQAVPGNWLGVMGGGQLARMFSIVAQQLGYRTMILDPDSQAPASSVCNRHLTSKFDDKAALDELKQCVAVTVESENLPIQSLEYLSTHTRVAPSPYAVGICQDRLKEKKFLKKIGACVVPYLYFIDGMCFQADETDIDFDHSSVLEFLPGILKTVTLGYDGKGQTSIKDLVSLKEALNRSDSNRLVLEKRLDLFIEFSIILCRNLNGDIVVYPVQQNRHQNGILALTVVPAPDVSFEIAQIAIDISKCIAINLNYIGVLCVEFFIDKAGSLFVNEIAPRPHNSGHYTIDACETSQFEQQVRSMAGLSLGNTCQHSHAAMLNIIGDFWLKNFMAKDTSFENLTFSRYREPDWNALLSINNAHLHLYGKTEVRRGRKMGHITLTGRDPSELDFTLAKIESILYLK